MRAFYRIKEFLNSYNYFNYKSKLIIMEIFLNLVAGFLVQLYVFLMWLVIFAGDPIPTWFWYLMLGQAVIIIAHAIYRGNNPRYF